MRQRIMLELYKHRDEFISGSQLALKMGISRVAVWKHIEALKQEGYEIEAVSGKGYHLIDAHNIIIPEVFNKVINTSLIGKNFLYYPQTDSTNELAKRLLKQQPIASGTVLVTGKQTEGKGRRGRHWESPRGGLWFSIILQPKLPLTQVALFSLVCAVAACEALKTFSVPQPAIKWPNDIFINGKKIVGILLEVSGELELTDYVIVGIGINVNVDINQFNQELKSSMTSLARENGRLFDQVEILAEILSMIEKYYFKFIEHGFSDILLEFKKSCFHLNRQVKIYNGSKNIEGINVDIDDMGSLVIDTGNKIEKITTGDVSLIAKQEEHGCI